MPMIRPGAKVRSDSRLATNSVVKAAMTVAPADVITSATLVSEYRRAPAGSSPATTCSRDRKSRNTM